MNRRHISKVKKGIASIVLVTLLVSNSMLALAEGSESGTSTAKESTTEESTTEKSANNEGAKEENEADTSTGTTDEKIKTDVVDAGTAEEESKLDENTVQTLSDEPVQAMSLNGNSDAVKGAIDTMVGTLAGTTTPGSWEATLSQRFYEAVGGTG